jgi:hypothetical protein
VIRLWNRVGWHRTVAVLLLLAAAGGGVAVAADRQTQQSAVASPYKPTNADRDRDANELTELEAMRAEAERAARRDAQRKADEAAVAAAEQAKVTAAPTTKASAAASKKPPGPPGKPVNIPASCAEFTGNRGIGCAVMLDAGFGLDQWDCLDKLFKKESGWNHKARNPGTGAFGIPQALPGNKMASVGADWETNPATQVRWGLGYIKGRYSTPCGAWAHSQRTGWY